MHLTILSRFLVRPTTWAVALGSLGLSILAATPGTGRSDEPPGPAQAAAIEPAQAAAIEEDEFAPAGEDEAEEPGSVQIAADDEEEPAGSVSIRREEEIEEPAGSAIVRRVEPPPAIRSPRIKSAARPLVPTPGRSASPPRQVVRPKMLPPSRGNPTAKRYPFERVAPSPRPAAGPVRPPAPKRLEVAAEVPVATAPPAVRGPARPAVIKPVVHESIARTPFVDDEQDTDDVDEDSAAPARSAGPDAAEAQAPVAGTAPDCPPISEGEIQDFSQTIDATIRRHPIGSLKADMQMRLSGEQSSLMDATDRERARAMGRCTAENDRAVVRQYYRQKFGPGYDRGSKNWDPDDTIAPDFPFAHHPLYFEDPNLERCGYSQGCCLQPLVSGFQFYGNVALLPLKMLMIRPCSYVYPQTDCDPCTRYSCLDNMLGPYPDRLFSSPCYSTGRRR